MVLRQILQEIADTGDSETYHDVWLADFKEMPVSVIHIILGKLTGMVKQYIHIGETC